MLRTISNFKRLSGNFSPPAHAKITQPRFEILNSCPILLRMSCKDQRDGHQTPSALLNLTKISKCISLNSCLVS